MRFNTETLREQHPQARLIPLPLWIGLFREELTEHQLTLMQTEVADLKNHSTLLTCNHPTEKEKVAYWLAIAFAHQDIDHNVLIDIALQLAIPAAEIFMAACCVGKLNLLQQVIQTFGNPGFFERMISVFGKPSFLEPLWGHYSINLADMLAANSYGGFRKAAEHGHRHLIDYLITLAPDQMMDMIHGAGFSALNKAVEFGHLPIVERLVELSPTILSSMMMTGRYNVFYSVACSDDLSMFNRLIELTPELTIRDMMSSKHSFSAIFEQAFRHDSFLVIARLMDLAPDTAQDMIAWDGLKLIQKAAKAGQTELVSRCLRFAKIFHRVDCQAKQSSIEYIYPFVEKYLERLQSSEDPSELIPSPLNLDDDGNFLINNEVRLWFYILLHLIKRKESVFLKDIETLINIPALNYFVSSLKDNSRSLIVTAVHYNNKAALQMLFANQFSHQRGSEIFSKIALDTSLCLSDKREEMVEWLLHYPEVFDIAMHMPEDYDDGLHYISHLLNNFVSKKIHILLEQKQHASPVQPHDIHTQEEIKLYLCMLRYLITVNGPDAVEHIQVLMDFPAIKSQIFLEDKTPGKKGLFKLALSSGNQTVVSLFLNADKKVEAIDIDAYIPQEGPIPQNVATIVLLSILKYCLFTPKSVQFEIDSRLDEIIVTLPNAVSYNLSLLFKHADLTQLSLTDELLDQYILVLSQRGIIQKPKRHTIKPVGILCQLHPAVLNAINIYTTKFYRIINPLCRGQIPEELMHLPPAERSQSIMEALFVAMFSAHGLTKWYELQVGEYHDTHKPRLLRRDLQGRPNHVGFFSREQANISTSITPEGSEYFKHRTHLVMVQDNHAAPNISSISQAPHEQEILFPSGTVFIYSRVAKGINVFKARVVRTPELIDVEGYQAWIGDALRFAFLHYLDKPYPSEHTVIPRPNHGIVHTMRTLTYVDTVIDYFMHHAKAEYQPYFHQISSSKLKIALVFYSTGRDSEIAFDENPALYRQFRKKSATHFKEYHLSLGEKYKESTMSTDLTWSEKEIEMYSELLEKGGDPGYLKDLQTTFPNYPNHGFKIALWSVLVLSHCLDLARCYDARQYAESTTEKFFPILLRSEKEQLALAGLRSFAIRAILATNDHCLCQLQPDNRLVLDKVRGRGALFSLCSKNPKESEKVLQTLVAEARMASNHIDQHPKCSLSYS